MTSLSCLAAAVAVLPQARGDWVQERVLKAGSAIEACAIAELDPDSPGGEVVAACTDGTVYLTRQDGPAAWPWKSTAIAEGAGPAVGLAVGDADAAWPGPEILVRIELHGPRGARTRGGAYLLHRTKDPQDTRFDFTVVHEAERPLAGAVLADALGDGEELEVVLAEGNRVRTFLHASGGWEPGAETRLETGIRRLAPHPLGVLVACDDGRLYQLVPDAGSWNPVLLDEAPPAIDAVTYAASIVLVARADGSIVRIPANAKRSLLVERGPRLRALILDDLDPFGPQREAVLATPRQLRILYENGADWKPRFETRIDETTWTCVATGPLDPESPGNEVAAGDSGGSLSVFWQVP